MHFERYQGRKSFDFKTDQPADRLDLGTKEPGQRRALKDDLGIAVQYNLAECQTLTAYSVVRNPEKHK